ncbi:MAG: hypothetical protein MHPSP_000437 [Paramarteilia canceri]
MAGTTGQQRGRLGFTHTKNPRKCMLKINGRKSSCNRIYSIAAILPCFNYNADSTDLSSHYLSKSINESMSSEFCNQDYTAKFENWKIENRHRNDIFGQIAYVDTQHPLKDGILSKWSFDLVEYDRKGLIYPVVWRELPGQKTIRDFEIVCWTTSTISSSSGVKDVTNSI